MTDMKKIVDTNFQIFWKTFFVTITEYFNNYVMNFFKILSREYRVK